MTSPMTGVPAPQAVPPQQQQGVAPVEKQGESRFDGVLADKARGSGEVTDARAVEGVGKAERPVVHAVSHVVRALEQGQRDLDRIIQQASSGKPFSNAELLSLQASMYRYTQELDLVSRVVEKATTGLKDVVKTQV